LIRFYKAANGLKTGSTSKAGFCISATAERNGMQLIAVVMGSPTRDSRNDTAKALLDHGFANYRFYHSDPKELEPIKVLGGVESYCSLICEGFDSVLAKDTHAKGITVEATLPKTVKAPIKAGEKIGEAVFKAGDEIIGTASIKAAESVGKLSFSGILRRLIASFFYS
jgi:D-alanyl-D-alanine carboxypeptidase (penicillin-binding protein 5/6)